MPPRFVSASSLLLDLRPKSLANSRFVLGLALSVGLLALSAQTAPVFAQVQIAQVQNVPVQANPGQLTPTQKQDEIKKQTQQDPDKKPEEVKLQVPEEPPVVQVESPQFMVKKITLEGVSVLKDTDLQEILSKYEGRDVTLAELGKAVDEINQMYRKKGYMTTQAYVPPQDIEGGNVTIKVVEGRIGKFEIQGNKYYRAHVIKNAFDETPGSNLNIGHLERELNNINRQGKFLAKATLSPGEETGQTNVLVNVQEQQPWQITATADNQGRPFIGTYRAGIGLTNNNLLGYGDHLNLRWIGSAGTQIALANYGIPINRYGTEVGFNFGFSYVDVDLHLPLDPKIEGNAFNYGLTLTQPLDKDRNWTLDGSFNIRRINSFFEHQRTNVDDIASLQTGLTYNKPDRYGRTFVRGQFTFAPDWFNSNRQFFKSEVFGNRILILPKGNLLILRSYAQFTPDALPAAEQMQIGGAFNVRGYTEGLLAGDRGYNFGVEHRFPIPGLRAVSPWLAERVQGATFFDIGQVWLDTSNTSFVGGLSNSNKRTLLVSAGTGLRVRLNRLAAGFVDFGFGLADRGDVEPNAQPTFRLHFGIESNLLPDDYKSRGNEKTTFDSAKGKGKKASKPSGAASEKPEASMLLNEPASSLALSEVYGLDN